MSKFELVIFDCDGVLVDSERITNTVFAQMLNELGLNVTLEDMFEIFVGNSMKTCLEIIQAMLNKPVPETFVTEYKRRSKEALQSDLQAVDGIQDALDEIDKLNLPYCVASSGDREKMTTTLGITNLLPKFQGKLFSVTEVANSKPHPDVFLYAAKKMSVEPEKCIVVEDTPIGVEAGVRAGMTVFGYAKLMKAEKLKAAGAAITFDDMKLLPDLILSYHN